MEWLLEKLGTVLDWIVGDRTTVEFTGRVAHKHVTVRPSLADADVKIGVTITQLTFETHYERWWLKSSVRSVYHVLAFAPEDIRHQLDPRLFQAQCFPLLCNSFLKHTQQPHLYAFHAFVDRMGPFYPTIKCEV